MFALKKPKQTAKLAAPHPDFGLNLSFLAAMSYLLYALEDARDLAERLPGAEAVFAGLHYDDPWDAFLFFNSATDSVPVPANTNGAILIDLSPHVAWTGGEDYEALAKLAYDTEIADQLVARDLDASSAPQSIPDPDNTLTYDLAEVFHLDDHKSEFHTWASDIL